MTRRFTIGIEEEYQIVDRWTGELTSGILDVLEWGTPVFGDRLKTEVLQSVVELVTPILPDIAAARRELYCSRAQLSRLMREHGLALISAGTHPGATWQTQQSTPDARYSEMANVYQHLARSALNFGLHIHIALPEKEQSIRIMNQVRTWLPHLLALSANSPFWEGQPSGIKSYRSAIAKRLPRTGTPGAFSSWADFDRIVQELIANKCIEDAKQIWWDIRPHPFYGTLEFRICDMPGTLEDTLAIVAICQALVARLVQCDEQGEQAPILDRDLIDENKWHAMRYGLDATIVDFTNHRPIGMRDAIREMLDFLGDVVGELGSQREMQYVRALLENPAGSGADRQLSTFYEYGGSVEAVTRSLMDQTLRGVLKYSRAYQATASI